MYIFISVSFKKLFEKNLQNTITDCIVGIIKGLEAVIDEQCHTIFDFLFCNKTFYLGTVWTG